MSESASSAPLVAREVGRLPLRAPDARLGPARLDAEQRARPPPSGELPDARVDARRRPRLLGHPAARPHLVGRPRLDRVLHPDAQHRLVHDAGLDALEPVVEPAHALLQEADRRPGRAVLGERVRPRPDQPLARARRARRAGAGPRSCSRRQSRRPRRPGTRSRSSPRRPSRASSTRRAAGATSQCSIQGDGASRRASQGSRQPSP